jgi:hypothetical protein
MEEQVSQKTGKCKNYEAEWRNLAQTLYCRVFGATGLIIYIDNG